MDHPPRRRHPRRPVSMESGLEGRNNLERGRCDMSMLLEVSMESGLEGRNNQVVALRHRRTRPSSQWSPA